MHFGCTFTCVNPYGKFEALPLTLLNCNILGMLEVCSDQRVPFPGRVIFDHLPKTAGMAVNAWLRKELGREVVSDTVIDHHRSLIGDLGGRYSVISAHVFFNGSEGFDERYKYVTLLRDPIDRVVSWLYFVVKNHNSDNQPQLYPASMRFLESDGKVVDDVLRLHIENHYLKHFSRIYGTGREDDEVMLQLSIQALEHYDVIGIYDRMPEFLDDLGALIGIPSPGQLERVNATDMRPAVEQISPALRVRIEELNAFDMRLFDSARLLAQGRISRCDRPKAPDSSCWAKKELYPIRNFQSDDITVNSITMASPDPVAPGAVVSFNIEFQLHEPVACLQAGLHIHDSKHRCAFGVNNGLQRKDFGALKPGCYRITHHVSAQLPAGRYTIGFAFASVIDLQDVELFWQDVSVEFSVEGPAVVPGIGYAPCLSDQFLWNYAA